MIGRERERVDIKALLEARKAEGDFVRICAPMVRYSQLAFRHVVRRHGVDVTFTPMIVSDSFVRSWRAREADFATSKTDGPLVVQFAAAKASDFAHAAVLAAPYADAVDLNCGCPQKWAMQEGLGSHLISKPELIADMVKQARAASGIPVSVKIRLRNSTRETVELCRRAEKMGAEWISVHGRTPKERRCPVHYDEIRAVKDAIDVPVVANGDVFTLDDAHRIVDITGVNGVMSARGLLANPALFDGYTETPMNVVEEYVEEAILTGTSVHILHHHVIFMMDKLFGRIGRQEFNRLTSNAGILSYLRDNFDMSFNRVCF